MFSQRNTCSYIHEDTVGTSEIFYFQILLYGVQNYFVVGSRFYLLVSRRDGDERKKNCLIFF